MNYPTSFSILMRSVAPLPLPNPGHQSWDECRCLLLFFLSMRLNVYALDLVEPKPEIDKWLWTIKRKVPIQRSDVTKRKCWTESWCSSIDAEGFNWHFFGDYRHWLERERKPPHSSRIETHCVWHRDVPTVESIQNLLIQQIGELCSVPLRTRITQSAAVPFSQPFNEQI